MYFSLETFLAALNFRLWDREAFGRSTFSKIRHHLTVIGECHLRTSISCIVFQSNRSKWRNALPPPASRAIYIGWLLYLRCKQRAVPQVFAAFWSSRINIKRCVGLPRAVCMCTDIMCCLNYAFWRMGREINKYVLFEFDSWSDWYHVIVDDYSKFAFAFLYVTITRWRL